MTMLPPHIGFTGWDGASVPQALPDPTFQTWPYSILIGPRNVPAGTPIVLRAAQINHQYFDNVAPANLFRSALGLRLAFPNISAGDPLPDGAYELWPNTWFLLSEMNLWITPEKWSDYYCQGRFGTTVFAQLGPTFYGVTQNVYIAHFNVDFRIPTADELFPDAPVNDNPD